MPFFLFLFLLFPLVMPASSPDSVIMEDINVTATVYDGELSKIPGSISVLSTDKLEQYTNLSVHNTLNSIPGVYMHHGTFSTNRIVIRGIGSRTPYGSNRIKAYINDIPITNGDGVTVVEDIEFSNIGRIELIKGPSSALYGAGLGGTIKLSTKKNPNTIETGFRYGSFNTRKTEASVNYNSEQFNINTSYFNTKSDGFRQNNHYTRHNAIVSGNKKINNSDLSFTVLGTSLNAQIPSSLSRETFTQSPQSAASNWLAVEGYEQYDKLIAGITLKNNLGKNTTQRTTLFGGYQNTFELRPFNNLSEDIVNYGLRSFWFFHKDKFEIITGIELFSENYNWKTFNETQESVSIVNKINEHRMYGNISGQVHYNITSRARFSGAINLNKLYYDYAGLDNDQGQYGYPVIISPRIGLSYKLTSSTTSYLSAGHGFSSPSLEETLRPNGMKNENLKPEQGWMYEAGIRWHSNNSRIFIDGTAYYIDLNDLLVTKRISEEIFTGINAGKTSHKGFELQSNVVISDNTKFPGNLEWQLAFSASDNTFIQFNDDGINYNGNKLPGIPAMNMQNTLNWSPFQQTSLTLNHWLHGKEYLDDANDLQHPQYNIFSFNIKHHFNINKKITLELRAGINNLFDQHYASMILVNAPSYGGSAPRYYYPGRPRNFFFSLFFYLQ
ncbi:MAG: TonB-dependent receptor [Prolixibacteraceae bacterium]|nr:TonB-dependent receptor [Prolixibacteraceae bacterium]